MHEEAMSLKPDPPFRRCANSRPAIGKLPTNSTLSYKTPRTIMVKVLPLLVTPYAKTVPLRPSSVLRTTLDAAREYTCAQAASHCVHVCV